MKNQTKFRNGYHEEGIETVTILLAILTVSVIFYSIYSAF